MILSNNPIHERLVLIVKVFDEHDTGRPKRLFILVNPFGGKKCGKKIYEAEIKPLFEAAGVNVTMQGFRSGMHVVITYRRSVFCGFPHVSSQDI
jgi:hypothetical protein